MPTLTDLLNAEQPEQGTLAELTSPTGIRTAAKKNPGYDVLGGIRDVGKMLYDIPVQTKGALGGLLEDADPYARGTTADVWQAEAKARTAQRAAELTPEERAKKIIPLPNFLSESGAITRGDIQDTSQSTGFSLAAMGAGLAGAAAGSVVGPAGTAAGALAGAGTAAYKMDKALITRQLIDAAAQTAGRPLTAEERTDLLTRTEDIRTNHALWEAGPEAVGTALSLTGVGKIFKGAATGATKKIISGLVTSLGGELSTETITQIGQNIAEHEMGLGQGEKMSWDAKSAAQALKEVAPSVLTLTGLTGGAGAVAGKAMASQSKEKDTAQAALLDKLTPEDTTVSVEGGEATITKQTANSTTTMKVSVADATKVMAAGGKVEDVAKKQFSIDDLSDPANPTQLSLLVRDKKNPDGRQYDYQLPEGMTQADFTAITKKMNTGQKFAWLRKEATQILKGEVTNAPTTEPQATSANEPVQAVQPGPEPMVVSAPAPLTAATPEDIEAQIAEAEQQVLNEEINNAVNIPAEAAPVPAAVTRDVGEAAASAPEEVPEVGRGSEAVGAGAEQTPVKNPQGVNIQIQAQAIDPSLKYDGESTGIHYFTPQEGAGAGGTFTVQDTSKKSIKAALVKHRAKFAGTPSASIKAPVSAPKGVTSKKSVKVPPAYAKIAKAIDTVIKEDGVSDDYKRVPSFEAIAAYREKYPDDSPDTAMSEMAWMPEAEYADLTAVQDEEVLLSETAATGTTTAQVEQELKDFLGSGFDNLVRKSKLEVVQGVEQLPEAGVPLYTKARKIAGVYLPTAKKVVLVANNVKPGDVRYVMMHEGTHALLREDAIFIKQKDSILSDFEALAASDDSVKAAMAKVPANTGLKKGETYDTLTPERKAAVDTLRTEESLAYWLQNKANHQHSIFKRIISAIKAALYRLGIAPGRLTASDMSALFTQGTQAWSRQDETSQEVDDPALLFSRIDDTLKAGKDALDTALTVLRNPKRKGHNFWMQHADKVLAFAPISHLAQTYGKTIHWIQDISNHANELEATTNRLIDDFYAIHEKAKEAAEKEKGVDGLNEAMLKATFNQMDPTKKLMEQDWVSQDTKILEGERKAAAEKAWKQAGMKKATGMTLFEAHTEAVNAYRALGPKTQKEMVNMAQYLNKLRDMDRDSSMAFIKAVSKENTPLRTSLMSQFNTSFSTIKGMYFPLSRYGKYILKFIAADGREVSENFDTYSEMDDARLKAVANGADSESVSMQVQDEIPPSSVAMPAQLLDQLRESITKQYMADVDPSDKSAKQHAEDRIEAALTDFNQIALRWLPDTAALKNSIRRKSTLGANPNMLRSVNGYVQRHAGKIAWTTVGKKIEQAIAGFAEENKEMSKDRGNANLVIRGHLLNTMRKWLNAVHKERIGKFASFIGKVNTGMYMTSPSTFLVQLTQLPTLTLPHLAARYKSIPKALAAVKRASVEAFSKKFTKDAMRTDEKVNEVYDAIHRKVGYKDNHPTKDVGDDWFSQAELMVEINKLNAEQKKLLALREAEALNLLDISAVHEAVDEAQGKRDTKFGTALHYALMPMKYGELGARKAAILATFELATAEGGDFFKAMEDTRDVIDKTIYNFSIRDKGWMMQKSILRIPFTFQTYRIKTALRIGLLFRDAVRTIKTEGMTEDQIAEAKDLKTAATREFVGIMTTSAALAGTMGVPFAGTLIAILNLLMGDDDEPVDVELMYTNWLREQLGETGGDLAAFGGLSMFGMNLSKRIGMGDLFGMQSAPPENLHGAGLAAWWAGNLIGPTFSVVQGGFRGYDEIINKGNYLKGLEAAAPKPLKDGFKAIRIGTEGLKNGQGKRLLADEAIGPDEIVLVALGFNADEIAKAQSAERALNKLSTKISERRGKLIKQAAQAFVEGDDASPALEKIRNFNRSMPLFGINGGDIRPAIRKILTGELGTTGPRESLVSSQYEVPSYSVK